MTSRSTDRPGRSDAVATRSDAATSRSDAVGADNAETQPRNCTYGNRTPAVTDLALCNILEQQACGNLTGEQARTAIRKHVQS